MLTSLEAGSISATNIWKRFKADPTQQLLRARLGQMRRYLKGERRGWRWALRDIDFEVQPGESVGLVGINGSGKSTLLKILTQVMYPYAGRVDVSGRIGALIEVQAGIHPELTGRENILLYGSMLGLPRRDVAKRFDDIVEFAQIEDAVDRQVKFYSSGMKMRVGFAVAAFLEPDVLLVDEVLAVGDSAFQQRCIDRMQEVLEQGSTLVFVSHDLAAVEAVCRRAVWLHDGRLREDGQVHEVLGSYRQALEQVAELHVDDGPVQLVKAQVSGPDGRNPYTHEPIDIRLVLHNTQSRPGRVCIGVSEGPATPMFLLRHDVGWSRDADVEVRCTIDQLPLPRGKYFLWAGVFTAKKQLMGWHPVAQFDVSGLDLDEGPPGIVRLAPIQVAAHWDSSDL